MEKYKMAQNDQNSELQLHIPGMGQFKYLKFIQSETNPADLIVKFPDGSEVVFPNYIPLAAAGAPPPITLDDGSVVPGQEIVSLIDDLDYDLIAPAAGNDAPGLVTPGNASFSADPSGPLGDDIGHGPYAGGVHISDATEPAQVPGYTDEGSVPNVLAVYDNRSDTYGSVSDGNMEMKTVFANAASASSFLATYAATGAIAYVRPDDTGDFSLTFTSTAQGGANDWDGIRVQLLAGETITITPDALFTDPDTGLLHQYYIGLDTDGSVYTGTNSVYVNFLLPVGWEIEHFSTDGSISYLMPEDGYVYVGTGYGGPTHANRSAAGDYDTLIEINDDHIITGTSGDNTLTSGSEADYLNGLAGDDTLIGNGGDDVLVGGAGSDEYVYTSASDGEDLIMGFDYDTTPGADNDVINLDALFDALDIDSGSSGTRGVVVDNSSDVNGDGNTDTVITVEYNGVAVSGFSITLDDTDLSYADLDTNNNLVVDES